MKKFIFLGFILLTLFLFFSIGSAMRESITYDEIVHIEEGKNAWTKQEFRIDTNNPPLIRELAVIPLLLSARADVRSPHQEIFSARMVIVFLSVLLGVALWFTANRFFGMNAACIAAALFVFDPNILAYNHYVTQDLGAALFFFLGYLSLVHLIEMPSWNAFIWHGVCLGLLAATKITLIPYYLLSATMLVSYVLGRHGLKRIFSYSGRIVLALIICLSVVWSTYFFKMNVIILQSDASGRVSDSVRKYATVHANSFLLSGLNFLEHQQIPLGNYIAVLKNTAVRSSRPNETFFLGEKYEKPQWYFMLITILLKTSLPLLILSIIGFCTRLPSHKMKRNRVIFTIPIVSIVVISLLSPLEPLVRYVLPLYPFLFVIASIGISNQRQANGRIITAMLSVWLIASTVSQYPHFISYANEFAGNRETKYLKFSDSNIDWGQGLITLSTFVQKEKPSEIRFSYFGRDDAEKYGFVSTLQFGSYKSNEICAFHDVAYPEFSGEKRTIISVSNWYECGYYTQPNYTQKNIQMVVEDMFLVFPFSGKVESKP